MAAAAHAVLKKKLEREGSEDVQAVFDQYDKDGSGDIDKLELKSALGKLHVVVTDEQLEKVLLRFGGADASSLDVQQFDDLVVLMRKRQEEAKASKIWKYDLKVPIWLPAQMGVRRLYTKPICVWLVAAVILANFLVTIIEKEIDPAYIRFPTAWRTLDDAFNIIFLIELLFNMYGYGGPRQQFWKDFWNVFDTIIVTVGLLLMSNAIPSDSPLANLKMLRAFRVFRLFKRVKSLNKIVVALAKAIPGMANAFVLMLIVFCFYAILAVELFADFGADGTYVTYTDDGNLTISSLTARGFTNGYEYYGTFSRALYTLFQVMTGESWSEAVARPLVFGYGRNAATASIYFVSFIIVTQMVLVNVVVAVLLDKFVTEQEEEPEEIDADALLDGASDVGTEASRQATAKPPKKTDDKLDLLIKEVAKLQLAVADLRAMHPQAGELTEMFTADIRAHPNPLAV